MDANDFPEQFHKGQRTKDTGSPPRLDSRQFAFIRGSNLLFKEEVYQIVLQRFDPQFPVLAILENILPAIPAIHHACRAEALAKVDGKAHRRIRFESCEPSG